MVQASSGQAMQLLQQADAELPPGECKDFGVKHALTAQAKSESNALAEGASRGNIILGSRLQPSGRRMPWQRSQAQLPPRPRYNNNLASSCQRLQALQCSLCISASGMFCHVVCCCSQALLYFFALCPNSLAVKHEVG